MEQLILEQKALIKQLNNTVKNAGKCSKSKRTIDYYVARLETLEALFLQIFNLNIKIMASPSDESEDYINSEVYDIAEEAYINLKTQFREGKSALEPAAPPAVQLDVAQNNQEADAPRNDFRLPTISIPSFNGEYNSWLSFKNSFNHLVANNNTLSNLQRLHYLKNSLSGDARKLIQHYDVADANYEAAWDKIKQRYDNKNFLINTHLKALIHRPSQSNESAYALRNVIDSVTDSLNGLRTLEVPTENWDPIIIYILIETLPAETHSAWQLSQVANADLPKLSDFLKFLENRFRVFEAIADKPSSFQYGNSNPIAKEKSSYRSQRQAHSHVASLKSECVLCQGNHYIRSCPSFLRMQINDRLKTAQQNNICINCLVHGHTVSQCRNKMNCTICNKRHHTLLHLPIPPTASTSSSSSNLQATSPPFIRNQNVNEPGPSSSLHVDSMNNSLVSAPLSNPILLATARINVFNSIGQTISLRGLIDPGSQVSFITTKAVQRLQLKPIVTNAKIFGIGQTYSGTSTKSVTISFQPHSSSDHQFKANFLTIPQITGTMPHSTYDCANWSHIHNLNLADPFFNRNGPIDMLLSAEVYSQIVLPQIQRGKPSEPIAQNTLIGWILFGGSSSSTSTTNLSLHSIVDIDARLRLFWESEELLPIVKFKSPEDIASENHFQETHSRDATGRFVVRLPFKSDGPISLGSTRENAIQRLLQIEKKFSKDPQLAVDYKAFMTQYEELGHMRREPENKHSYFIPHHPVIKISSSTTKLRIVFDASFKSSTGNSLNDLLKVGPTIQDDLTSLIIRWRKYPIAFTADLEKMYRQIMIHNLDQKYQRILWRESPSDPIQDFKLLTVTYGTACAQFLAIRALHQLAIDGASQYPLASQRILNDFYVDDLLSGSYEVSEALKIQTQLRELANTAGLNLRKWASNHDVLLQSIPIADREIKTSLLIEFDDTIKSLGIQWNPNTDKFTFQSSLESSSGKTTKRSILSEVSKLFDPIGWLSPLIIRSKILMQQLWILSVGWDDPLPSNVVTQWQNLREDLQRVNLFSLPRSMAHHSSRSNVELHGFSDASIHAYAAVVYSRILQSDNTYIITLIAAKSKVAPIKQVTLPRLELCGAHLLSKLLRKVSRDLKIVNTHIYAWCDSTIVLHWLQGHPNRLKTYVANRVSEILEHSEIQRWRHVSGTTNPADCATRGLDVESLKSHHLWWNGPQWLHQSEAHWPSTAPPAPALIPDIKTITLTSTATDDVLHHLIHSHSSATRLVRTFAFMLRFIFNVRQSSHRHIGPLTPSELSIALHKLICNAQQLSFTKEYRTLQAQREIHPPSSLLNLHPFIDDAQRLLRVGGRLQNSSLSFDVKHPIILPKDHHLTRLLILQTHLNTLHGGPELVSTMLRQRYWIINIRSAVRLIIHQCTRCYRFNAIKSTQLMANLPKPRVQVDRPFTHTGVDCAGPINLRMSKGRGAKSYKAYITLFVCLGTKAIHIEAVSDLSSPAFLAAYRRFTSRRGLPQHLYSDNGTNFVGASRILRKEAGIHLLQVSEDLVNEVANNGSTWHFIPPASPHFGGLWEAGIKSMKLHLKKIIGDSTLTYEELSTLLSQVEACLNSRPLCPTTADPSDLSALTPGHFLIGSALLAPPENVTLSLNTNIHTRWQLVQKMRNDFWKRFHREYLIRLQNRPKWASKSPNLEINDLVLIMDDNIPPCHWPLGRIVQTHPGSDDLVRVATVKCQSGIIKRPIAKLALLPIPK